MVVVTTKEMQIIDEKVVTELGIPSLVLMENAGVAVVNEIQRQFGELDGKRCLILVGKGNNGGDGLVVARHLLNKNVKVKVYLLAEAEEMSADARHNLEIFQKLQGEVHLITKSGLAKLKINLTLTDLVIDALLGTGFTQELTGILSDIVRLVNNCRTPVVSIDIPSGVNGTTGLVGAHAVRATLTVVLSNYKTGLLLYPGRDYCGNIQLVDIGIPKGFTVNIKRYLTEAKILELLPPRPAWAHKGTFGHCLVVAGSKSMVGAAKLTSHACLRTGAGLVTLALPETLRNQVGASEIITEPIPESGEGYFDSNSTEPLLQKLEEKTVLALGPGLGCSEEISLLVQTLLQQWKGPVVLDADGLNNITDLAWITELAPSIRRNWVFTPHPGEMGRLLGLSTAKVNQNRLEIAWETYKKLGVNIVLKGAPTIIAGDNQIYINNTGNPGMSSAGMGDVLTGIIAGLLSQGMDPFLASVAGVYLHGMAGDHLSEKYGQRGLLASDLLDILPQMLHN